MRLKNTCLHPLLGLHVPQTTFSATLPNGPDIDPDVLARWKSGFLYQTVVFRVHVSLPGVYISSKPCVNNHLDGPGRFMIDHALRTTG